MQNERTGVSEEKIAVDVVKQFLTEGVGIIGFGSGPMARAIIREISKLPYKENLGCIAASMRVKLEAEDGKLRIVDDSLITDLDIVFDGADQIDEKGNMIKDCAGSLVKEKILHSAASNIVISAESTKYVESINIPVPIEVHPFARYIVGKKLEELGGKPKLRMLNGEYIYVTENGNLILDTTFTSITDIREKEYELKNIAGVLEVGLFTRRADIYYKAKEDGSFEKLFY